MPIDIINALCPCKSDFSESKKCICIIWHTNIAIIIAIKKKNRLGENNFVNKLEAPKYQVPPYNILQYLHLAVESFWYLNMLLRYSISRRIQQHHRIGPLIPLPEELLETGNAGRLVGVRVGQGTMRRYRWASPTKGREGRINNPSHRGRVIKRHVQTGPPDVGKRRRAFDAHGPRVIRCPGDKGVWS